MNAYAQANGLLRSELLLERDANTLRNAIRIAKYLYNSSSHVMTNNGHTFYRNFFIY